MSSCATCGNAYDKAFQITTCRGESLFFDSFECAIQRLAPVCAHCGCKIIGHGSESNNGVIFCCAHCANLAGVMGVDDRQDDPASDQPGGLSTNLEATNSKNQQSLPSGWLELTQRVRRRLERLHHQAVNSPDSDEFKLLAAETEMMCNQMEHLHREAHRLLSKYGEGSAENAPGSSDIEVAEVERASVDIQREQHEQSAGPMEIIKALLLWRDVPEERVREESA
jgi:hypothetical protein